MIEVIKNNITTIVFSVLVHIVLITLLVFSFDWKAEPRTVAAKPNIVKAVVVDAGKIKAERDKLKRAEIKKKNQEKARLAKLKREEKKLQQKRAAEKKRLANVKKKRKAEEKKRKQEQKKLAKLKKEKKALKKKQAAEKKRKVAEQQRKAEKARLVKKKKQQDALKKKQALAKKKRDTEAKQRRQELVQQLDAEERAEANKLVSREIDKYTTLIEQKIQRYWLKPPGDLRSLLVTLEIRLIPGGDVIDVRIIRTSGNLIYDRSAERAVRKASPLPLPKDPAIAAEFYNFYFDFSK